MNRQMAAQAPKNSSAPSARSVLQRKCGGCREKEKILQRSAVGSAPETVPPIVHEVLRSPGQPLDKSTRGFMEPRFGHDLSRISPHTDTTAFCSMLPRYDPFIARFGIRPPQVQTKLMLTRPVDKYEQEADRVAETVARMSDSQMQIKSSGKSLIQAKPLGIQITPLVKGQLMTKDSEEQRLVQASLMAAEPLTMLQRQEELDGEGNEEEEEVVQAKSAREKNVLATSSILSHIRPLRASSQSWPEHERIPFESRFGYNFRQVRIHSDAKAAELARSLHARAFTIGQDIFFGRGQYSPSSLDGKRLLAHELTHVVQQEGGSTSANYIATVQRKPEKVSSVEQHVILPEERKPYPPVYWSIDRDKKITLVIPKPGVTLEDVANFLYGSPSAKEELAQVNKLKSDDSLNEEVPLRLIGKALTQAAHADLESSPKVPLGVSDPAVFMAKKQALDAELEKDFKFIVEKLDEIHYSDADEGAVIVKLQKWGEEKFTTNSKLYPKGGEYLDNLFRMLKGKLKDKQTSYYDLVFNHFDRVKEVASIRDTYSRLFKGDRGQKEVGFWSTLWEQVENGEVRDQIFSYFKGVGKGVWAGAKGMVTMAYNLVTNPKKFFSDIAKLPAGLKALWQNRNELWNKFANAPSEKQAEMIGEVFGEIEFMIASGGAAKGIAKLAEVPGKIGKIAKVVEVVTQLPSKALGIAIKGVATVVIKGVGLAVRGAVFAAKGVYRIAGKVLRGTWSVLEKTVGKVKTRAYYFYDDAAKVMRKIQAKFAKKFVHCSSPCMLTHDSEISLSRQKDILEEFAERAPAERAERQLEYAKKFKTMSRRSEKARHRSQFEDVEGRPRIAGHHGFPQYLGGRYQQELLNLSEDLHYLYHQELDLIVKIPRKLGGEYYRRLGRPEMQEILKKVVEHAETFDKRYGTKIKEALIRGIDESQPL